MIAVVQDDVARVSAPLISVNLAHQFGCDDIGGGLFPVAGHGVPCDGDEAELPREFQHVRTASAEGRAEEAGGLACELGKDVVGAGQLFEHSGIGDGR